MVYRWFGQLFMGKLVNPRYSLIVFVLILKKIKKQNTPYTWQLLSMMQKLPNIPSRHKEVNYSVIGQILDVLYWLFTGDHNYVSLQLSP